MTIRAWCLLPLARALASRLEAARGPLVVVGAPALQEALRSLGHESTAELEETARVLVLDRPTADSVHRACGSLREGGRAILIDRGWRKPPAESRTFALARLGFVEVGQTQIGRARLTIGVRRVV